MDITTLKATAAVSCDRIEKILFAAGKKRIVAGCRNTCYFRRSMDALSRTYEALLAGSYDRLDRIVINAYYRMGHDAGGFPVCGGG